MVTSYLYDPQNLDQSQLSTASHVTSSPPIPAHLRPRLLLVVRELFLRWLSILVSGARSEYILVPILRSITLGLRRPWVRFSITRHLPRLDQSEVSTGVT